MWSESIRLCNPYLETLKWIKKEAKAKDSNTPHRGKHGIFFKPWW